MDAIFLPSDGADRRALQALSERSNAAGAAQLTAHAGALACSGLLVAALRDTAWLWPAMWLHGLVLIFLFAALHETVHRTVFEQRWLNDAVAWATGLLLLMPPRYFRAFHFAHHRHTQDPVCDPELAVGKPRSLGSYLWHASGLPHWRERVAATLRHAGGDVREPFVARHQQAAIVCEARIVLASYVAVAAVALSLESSAPLIYWVIPALLGQPALRLFLLAEHTGCADLPDMLKNSRTTRSTALLRRLAWNMPYHAEHHVCPALPFHALPRAHDLLGDRVDVQATGYLAVQREILRGYARARAVSSRLPAPDPD